MTLNIRFELRPLHIRQKPPKAMLSAVFEETYYSNLNLSWRNRVNSVSISSRFSIAACLTSLFKRLADSTN
jgi:hypothetical protein